MSINRISIVGSGHTKFGNLKDHNLESLIVSAAQEALHDANISGAEIDAAFLGHFNAGMVPDSFASSLIHLADEGLRFKPAMRCENACASGAAAISAGINSILAGRANTVLVVGVEKMTSNSTSDVTKSLTQAGYQNNPEESSLSFPQLFALATEQYKERYQDPLFAMAQIASKNHSNAMSNPLAQLHREMSVEFCHEVSDKNPEIAPPLRLTDCSLISDGAAAIVLTKADLAKNFKHEVRFKAFEHVSDFLPLKIRDFISFESAERSMQAALKNAQVSLDDLNFAEVHDCFTIAELLIYEALGLTPRGQGYRALEEGLVYKTGKLPVNTSGGLKAKGHPVGATGVSMHALAYRQLTGQAGEMQLDNVNLGLVFNMGGTSVANYTSILEAVR
ncbi:acetyl-CoA acetyltransferase [Oligella urethralis]|uniref:thiolase domain-containing protein n=1 Tax=Oligella urethralis TaxID=90245 RepID=UPI000C9CE6D8|nr:thiolase domain-containing protein [Oligella urethralis]AVL71949.1 acetyl-CoA acetyltransferase [Oligella urethralis]PMC16659.1 acetyl-CoA acetyltransferase [Oligella urethralis]SUA52110.1 acetyl-CoA acetyltransferase [Oligella urethralis]